jgi:hypothetical protein
VIVAKLAASTAGVGAADTTDRDFDVEASWRPANSVTLAGFPAGVLEVRSDASQNQPPAVSKTTTRTTTPRTAAGNQGRASVFLDCEVGSINRLETIVSIMFYQFNKRSWPFGIIRWRYERGNIT